MTAGEYVAWFKMLHGYFILEIIIIFLDPEWDIGSKMQVVKRWTWTDLEEDLKFPWSTPNHFAFHGIYINTFWKLPVFQQDNLLPLGFEPTKQSTSTPHQTTRNKKGINHIYRCFQFNIVLNFTKQSHSRWKELILQFDICQT